MSHCFELIGESIKFGISKLSPSKSCLESRPDSYDTMRKYWPYKTHILYLSPESGGHLKCVRGANRTSQAALIALPTTAMQREGQHVKARDWPESEPHPLPWPVQVAHLWCDAEGRRGEERSCRHAKRTRHGPGEDFQHFASFICLFICLLSLFFNLCACLFSLESACAC